MSNDAKNSVSCQVRAKLGRRLRGLSAEELRTSIERARGGDREAFRGLFKAILPWLCELAQAEGCGDDDILIFLGEVETALEKVLTDFKDGADLEKALKLEVGRRLREALNRRPLRRTAFGMDGKFVFSLMV